MSNDHIEPHLRAILDNIANTHRYARAELREGMAALERVNGVTMSEPTEPMKIILEKSPWPNAEPRYLWTAYWDGLEDDLSETGATPEEALGRFLNGIQSDEPEID
jgi:hypothetical protein